MPAQLLFIALFRKALFIVLRNLGDAQVIQRRRPIGGARILRQADSGDLLSHGGGGEPLREWLKGLSREDRKRIGEDVKIVEFGWPVGTPVCTSLGDGGRARPQARHRHGSR